MKLSRGTILSGMFADPRKDTTNPIILEIKRTKGKYFYGTTTYRRSRIKIKGFVDKSDIYFVEYEILGGKVLIPNIFKGCLVDDSISGVAFHGDIRATFYLELQK